MQFPKIMISRVLAAGLILSPALEAQEAGTEPLEEIIVRVTPAQGAAGLPKGKIAYNIQSAYDDDIERMQSLDLADFLNRTMESVSINDAQNNPLQPDVRYRGFTASPLLGLAQGMSVYQNGVRINEPLGDAVNWDLLPESAIHSINLIGGANPLFGLNTLGGALSIDMKNGFNSPGTHLEIQGGSFERYIVSGETGGNRGGFAWYGNVHYFDEDGWRDESPSDALNFYGSIGWEGDRTSINLNGQYGESDLIGNGTIPVELLQIDRDAVFTAPDITANEMVMFSADANHDFTDNITFSGNTFFRRNKTDSFNGDGSEFAVCELGGSDRLLEGLDEDDLEELGLDDDDVCENQFADAGALETFLNNLAGGDEFSLDDIDELSGTGILSDEAINNRSNRVQKSYGTDMQLMFSNDLFGRSNQLIVGAAWFVGKSNFNATLELAELDPVTRNTQGLGTGTFVDEAATDIKTETETWSLYLTNTMDLTDRLSLTLSGRLNVTGVDLADQSGERPELNGEHDFHRFNPAVGLTYQVNRDTNLYGSYSESSRAPTPIELACNDRIFDLAVANAIAEGDDPDDVDFECRLPNAFLADPPLEQVVAKSFEFGIRGDFHDIGYHVGFFHTTNNDDIIFQTTGRATGLFANVDKTRRMGFESGFHGNWEKLDWFLAYSYIEATFEDSFSVLSPNHPFADEDDGTIQVRPGDNIPGVPDHQLKLGGDYLFNENFSIGAEMLYNSGQHIRGDESNQLNKVGGYAIVNLRARYVFNDHIQFFAKANNVFDKTYETFGLMGESPSEVEVPEFSNFSNPRFLGPGAPRAGFIGIKLSL